MKKGFTIIEVALVLAIAGLIFLMVFIALPGLRASQRDTSRRENVLSFIENVKKYQNNNRGALPTDSSVDVVVNWDEKKDDPNKIPTNTTSWARFYYDYFDLGKFSDPTGEYYKLIVRDCGSETVGSLCTANELSELDSNFFPNDYRMYVVKQASCDGEKAARTANPRKIAVLYKLEGAGIYCANT